MLQNAPSVQMQEIPPSIMHCEDDGYENDPEERISQRDRDIMIEAENEYYDDENDQDQLEV